MKRKTSAVGAVLVAILMSYGAWRMYLSHSQAGSDLDSATVRQMLDSEIAKNSLRSDVQNFLSSREVPHGTREGEGRVVQAIFRGKSRGIVRRDVIVRFRFDDSDRLIDYTVQDVFTGP